jgi:putative flippase GtrA
MKVGQTKTRAMITADVTATILKPFRALPDAGRLARSLPLIVRYGIVSGALGLPASIAQLMLLIFAYQALVGHVGPLALNALWLVNFEIGLLRNFLLHCWYSWGIPPTWTRVRHAHVAATGALIVDLVAFNLVVMTTHIIPLAQLFGASSGFLVNFLYNKFKTFAVTTEPAIVERSM